MALNKFIRQKQAEEEEGEKNIVGEQKQAQSQETIRVAKSTECHPEFCEEEFLTDWEIGLRQIVPTEYCAL